MKQKLQQLLKPIYIISLIAIISISAAIFLFYQYTRAQNQVKDLSEKPVDKSVETLNQVGKLMLLPTNENPTVATITDKDKLKDQTFFTQAENGDQIIIYVQSKKAILYRPSINKIVDTAPINTNSTPSVLPTKKP